MNRIYFFRCHHKQDANKCNYCPTCGMERTEKKPPYEWCVHMGLQLLCNKWKWRTQFDEGGNYDVPDSWKYCPFCGKEKQKENK